MAAPTNRRTPASRLQRPHVSLAISPSKTPRVVSGSTKRARSPDQAGEIYATQATPKRARAVPPPSMSHVARDEDRKIREHRKAEREAQKAEFRVKYTRAFPSWVFYFDLDILEPDSAATRKSLENQVSALGSRVDDFFSSEITHLITNQPVPGDDISANKENILKGGPSLLKPATLLKSPIKLRGRVAEETANIEYDHLVNKAIGFGMKIWTTAKLESVLERCSPTSAITTASASVRCMAPVPSVSTAVNSNQRPLTRLLQSERVHGTMERDPTQKRHDFHYFSRASYFVLVEDIRQELATIAALEYNAAKSGDGTVKATWPVLHCHPQARGPFIAFDEREKRRWEKSQNAAVKKDHEKEQKGQKVMRQETFTRKKAQLYAKKNGDLRRSVSMNNLHRRATHLDTEFHEMVDLDADNPDSANASGYLASTGTGGAYIAASGNSVGITSTTGTTSTTDNSLRNLQLPAALRDRIQQQVVTSRKYPSAAQAKQNAGTMGPPDRIPERPNVLRKSRSTNTLRLPKREEGKKPGYCESCRIKFDDFKTHIRGRKHRKFAADDANFFQLDFLLAQVQRRTLDEVEQERKNREAQRRQRCSNIVYNEQSDVERSSDDMHFPPFFQQTIGQQAWQDCEGTLDL